MQDREEKVAAELLRRRLALESLTEYARYIDVPGAPLAETEDDGSYAPVATSLARHHVLLLEATQRCIERPRGRTMLFLPPGSAKSTYATVVAPTWLMGVNPGSKVIGISYGESLAKKFGKRMRSIVRQPKYQSLFQTSLNPDSRAANEWALMNGSDYMAGGVLTGITGNRADFISIDDPIKGRQEADSEATRKSTLDAYHDDILTRLKPGGSVMLTQTRWHEMDLAGSILPEDYDGRSGMIQCRDGETWEVLCIPAECERADDPLGRQPGEMIWPEWFTEEHWKPFRRIPRTWNALYQQRPAAETGDFFRREWISEHDHAPPRETMHVYGASDYAVTESADRDYTVHVVVGVDPQNRLWLLDVWRQQASSDKWVESFCDLVLKWKPIGWAEETGQIKSGVGPFLHTRMRERRAYVAREVFPTRGDKAIRAQSIRGRMAIGGLHVERGAHFLPKMISELMSFPAGSHDDQVDALGLAGQILDKMKVGSEPLPVEPEDEEDGFTPPPLYATGIRRKSMVVNGVLPAALVHKSPRMEQ